MINLRSELQKLLKEALEKAVAAGELNAVSTEKVSVQYPPSMKDGIYDYASPIALIVGKQLKTDSAEVAEKILKYFINPDFVEKVDIVAPGFINFVLNSDWLVKKLDNIVEEGELFGTSNVGNGETVDLEFVSANPTGMPTFGNGRALFWADSLGKVLERSGYAVTREYYINDAGNQVRKYGESVLRRILQNKGVDVPFADDLYQGKEVFEIAREVEETLAEENNHNFTEQDLLDEELMKKISDVSVKITVQSTKKMLEEICKVKYDVWFSEKTLHDNGAVGKVLEEIKKRGYTYEKDGALWFASTKFGDDKDRVLVKENGEVTYLVADIAYHMDKFRRGFNKIVDFWGADHFGYIKRLESAITAMGEDVSKFRVIITQMIHVLENGEKIKMSKRAGTSVALNEVVERVGISASRFFVNMTALSSHMDFDLDLAKEQSDRNPVYYVQYAFVRLASILRKAQETNIIENQALAEDARISLNEPAEVALMRNIFRFPEVIEDVADSWDIQRLPHFAIELARSIHYFYDSVPVLNADSRELKTARLALALAAKTALGNLLDTLGVEKLQIM
jgi:arginyl-tRNA synthetase